MSMSARKIAGELSDIIPFFYSHYMQKYVRIRVFGRLNAKLFDMKQIIGNIVIRSMSGNRFSGIGEMITL
jgi:hypothetical protein